MDFALGALGSKQKEVEEVNRLTAAANVVFDLQTGRQPRHWLWLQAHRSKQLLVSAVHVVSILQRGGCAGFDSSFYMPLLFIFPILAPLLRPLAAVFPDKRLRRLREARHVIMSTAFDLIKRQRLFMAAQVARPRQLHIVQSFAPAGFIVTGAIFAEGS